MKSVIKAIALRAIFDTLNQLTAWLYRKLDSSSPETTK